MPDRPPSSPMIRVRVQRRAGIPVISVVGELDVATTPLVAPTLHAALDEKTSAVIADFSGVSFCGSSGLALLVTCHQRAGENGGRFLLAGCRRAVLRALEVTGMLDFLALYPSVEDAVGAPAVENALPEPDRLPS